MNVPFLDLAKPLTHLGESRTEAGRRRGLSASRSSLSLRPVTMLEGVGLEESKEAGGGGEKWSGGTGREGEVIGGCGRAGWQGVAGAR